MGMALEEEEDVSAVCAELLRRRHMDGATELLRG